MQRARIYFFPAAFLLAITSHAASAQISWENAPSIGDALEKARANALQMPPVAAIGTPSKNELERLVLPGLSNLAKVTEGIYRGARPELDRGAIASLRKLGVKKIINLQGGDLMSRRLDGVAGWPAIILALEPGESPRSIRGETAAAAAAGIESINVPLDSLDPITDQEATDIDRVLKLLAASSPAEPAYVHCEHGKDRTGLVIALYRMRYEGWSRKQAEAEMAAMGHDRFLDRLLTSGADLRDVLARFPYLGNPSIP